MASVKSRARGWMWLPLSQGPEDRHGYRKVRELMAKLELKDLDFISRASKALAWICGVLLQCSAVSMACDIEVDGMGGPGRPMLM